MGFIRHTLRLLAYFALVLGILGGAAYIYARTSLPKIDGSLTLAGPSLPTQIVRDKHGVPHIYARNLADAYFALGFVHAQDRLWQMEMNRRITSGRLSEVVGKATLESDRLFRTLGFKQLAEQQAAALNGDGKIHVDAYVAGVNAFIDKHSGALPPEFLLLGVTPAPWTAADTLAFLKLMALDLSGNWFNELARFRLATRLDQKQIQELFPPYPGDAPVALANLASLYRTAAKSFDLEKLVTALPEQPVEGIGSNNWVLAGDRTATGKPLLANDPHLGLATPALWYYAHLSAPGMEVIGATLPGVPGVVLGRNQRIAWGFTNTGPDTQDLYLERVDANDPTKYATPTGSAPFETREETIKVRFGDDVRHVVRKTRHGPVLSDLAPNFGGGVEAGYVLALQWTALSPGDRSAEAVEALSRVSNWDGFVTALKEYRTPQQNIVYADVDGNIGFIAPGLVPIRKPENDTKGLVPAPGWDEKYDWAGYVPYDSLPRSYNPSTGRVVTANHKIVPDSYPYYITSEWADPYRAARIEQMLAARQVHSVDSFKQMQSDVVSLQLAELLPLLLAAPVTEGDARRAHDLLSKWDGALDAGRAEPLIYEAWYRELSRLLVADKLGPLFQSNWRQRPQFVRNVLTDVDGQSRWCGAGPSGPAENCAALIARAFDLALADLRARYGGDMNLWRWGEAHMAIGSHRPLGAILAAAPWLRGLFEVRVPTPGDTFTVNVGRHNIADEAKPFANVHAASLRAIYDLGDLDRSLFMFSTGQSGNPLSPLYRDLAKSWAAVDYLPLTMKRADIDTGAMGTLTLEPKAR